MNLKLPITLIAAVIVATCSGGKVQDRVFHNFGLDFHEAVSFCKSNHGRLHLPFSLRENRQLFNFLRKSNHQRLWIGAHGGGTRDNRIWYNIDREVIAKEDQYWGPLQPNDFDGSIERCGEVRALCNNTVERNWYDGPCDRKLPFLCEYYILFNGDGFLPIREENEPIRLMKALPDE